MKKILFSALFLSFVFTATGQTKHKITVAELKPPAHTKEEAAYYLIYKEESPSYLHKLVASDYWKAQQKIAEQEEMKGYAERVKKRKQDSIAQEEIRKQNIIAMEKMRKSTDSVMHRRDSISKIERKKYIEEQKRQQSKNNSNSPFTIVKD